MKVKLGELFNTTSSDNPDQVLLFCIPSVTYIIKNQKQKNRGRGMMKVLEEKDRKKGRKKERNRN